MNRSRTGWWPPRPLRPVKIGDPRDPDTLVGPLIDEAASRACAAHADIERVDAVDGGFYVRPAIVEVDAQQGIVLQETFARSSTSCATERSSKRSISITLLFKDLALRSSPTILRKPSSFNRRPGRIAALPTSTSGHRARRSAGVRRGEGDRRRPGKWLGQLAGLYATLDQYHQLRRRPPPGTGDRVHRLAHVPPRQAERQLRLVADELVPAFFELVEPRHHLVRTERQPEKWPSGDVAAKVAEQQ